MFSELVIDIELIGNYIDTITIKIYVQEKREINKISK